MTIEWVPPFRDEQEAAATLAATLRDEGASINDVGENGETWGVCPFAEEIHGDYTHCFCTEKHRQECADDI